MLVLFESPMVVLRLSLIRIWSLCLRFERSLASRCSQGLSSSCAGGWSCCGYLLVYSNCYRNFAPE